MVLLTINISYENKEKLEREANKSGLVNELLSKHYKLDNKSAEQIKADREALLKKMDKEITEMDKMIEVVEKIKEVEIEEKEQSKAKQDEIINSVIDSAKEVFGVDITKEQAQTYKLGDYVNLADYLEELKLIKVGDQDNDEQEL